MPISKDQKIDLNKIISEFVQDSNTNNQDIKNIKRIVEPGG